jgi:hypothetical protein
MLSWQISLSFITNIISPYPEVSSYEFMTDEVSGIKHYSLLA